MTDDLQRRLSPSLFALAALSFLLPFATVSCDDARTTFTGIQLVTRTVPRGGVLHGDCSGDLSVCVERAAAGTATVAFVAALAGLLLGVLGVGRGPGWCALGGLGAVIVLPFEGGLSGPDVTTHSGYDLALLLFACVWFLHVCHAALWEPRAARPWKEEFHMRKTILALLGAVLVVGSAAAVAAADPGGATPDVRLLATYEPVMQFDPLEPFQPVKVQSFLTDAVLSDGHFDQTGCTPSAAGGATVGPPHSAGQVMPIEQADN